MLHISPEIWRFFFIHYLHFRIQHLIFISLMISPIAKYINPIADHHIIEKRKRTSDKLVWRISRESKFDWCCEYIPLTLICKETRGAGVGAAGVEHVEIKASSAGKAVTSWLANTSLTTFITTSTAPRCYVPVVSQWAVAHTGSTAMQEC